jgi:FtsP/CotA-like multicopper oxidase with cupredoxin domain
MKIPRINLKTLTAVAATLAVGLAKMTAVPILTPGVDYTKPHYAYSPPLRKFVDSLPGMTAAGANNLGQYIPVAVPDTTTYPGDDYYEIALVEYREQMHSDLPPVVGDKADPNATGGVRLRGYVQEKNGVALDKPHYLGPWIVAQSGRPVRVKFTNRLPTGAAGNLFLPVDTTIMGAGTGTDGVTPVTQNRASIHLHGGMPGWISDGTPNQWITPAGENTPFKKGVLAQNVPDMDVPSDGSMTFYWPNGHSGRMLWYHDHTYGMTRLNVYAGEVSGYLVTDPYERQLSTVLDANGNSQPGTQIPELPLVIQDKTFVPDAATMANLDPTWDSTKWGKQGELWFPHVYVPNQDPTDPSGGNGLGRWDFGPWLWPPQVLPAGVTPPALTAVPESFHDTPVVNGTPYPYYEVDPTEYRFHILNACNERYLNLQWYVADPNPYTNALTGKIVLNKEVRMVPANTSTANMPNGGIEWPSYYPTAAADDRLGGWPDPALAGPAMVQVANEAGVLPQPFISTNVPIGFSYNRRTIVVLNVQTHAMLMGPAERADVIVDFAPYAGQTLILYNDAPAPFPAFDTRNDPYTGAPDQTDAGGPATTQPGMGPNVRTIMQVRVKGTPVGTPSPTNMVAGTLPLNWANPARVANLTTNLPAVFKATQQVPIVPQPAYNPVGYTYNGTPGGLVTTTNVAHINDQSITYIPYGSTTPVTAPFVYKSIQENFDNYGRMNAVLGTELPFTSMYIQTTLMLNYVDPVTEIVAPGETQFWWIAHNGVDTHTIHFHLVDVQVINRVGWDGATYEDLVDPNEYGFKDSVRMHPLENILVAVRAKTPQLPFGIPDAIRPLDATTALGSTNNFSGIDPYTGQAMTVTNQLVNNKWEYMWHCHLLGHEENDMMRPISFTFEAVPPTAPGNVSGAASGNGLNVTWTDATPRSDANTWGNPANEIGFQVLRAPITKNGNTLVNGAFAQIATVPANRTSYLDTTANGALAYAYQVAAFNAAGTNSSAIAQILPTAPNTPTSLTVSAVASSATAATVTATWVNGANLQTSVSLVRSTSATFANGNVTNTLAGTTTTYADTSALTSTTYYYRIYASNAVGASAPSATVSITTPPGAPSSFAATSTTTTPTSSTVNLTWSNGSNPAGSVILVRASDAAFTTALVTNTLSGNPTSYADSTAVPSTQYYYRAQASNANGTSVFSATVTLTTPAFNLPKPTTPTGLAATASTTSPTQSSVTLTWVDGTTVAQTSLLIERATTAGFTGTITPFTVTPGSAATYTDTSVVPNTTYYYRISAVNAAGSSPVSAAVTVATPAYTLPAPTGLTLTRGTLLGAKYATLNWTGGGSGLTGYTIQRSTSPAFPNTTATVSWSPIPATSTTTTDSALLGGRGQVNGTTYYYRVRANSTLYGSSAYSATVQTSW